MTTIKKPLYPEGMSYEEASARHRAEFIAKAKPIQGEIFPINGRIHVVLSGKPMPEPRRDELLGPSEIDVPDRATAPPDPTPARRV